MLAPALMHVPTRDQTSAEPDYKAKLAALSPERLELIEAMIDVLLAQQARQVPALLQEPLRAEC